MHTLRSKLAAALIAAALGSTASAQITTLRLEIDYMVDANHSHIPTQAEVNALVQMFACHGITLIAVIDDAVPHVNTLACGSLLDPFFNCTGSGTFASYKAQYADQGAGWHYVLFGHRYNSGAGTGSSGVAEFPGNDLFVADDVVGAVPFWRAATLAHELGHNLGLGHMSPATPPASSGPFAPNLASVMSYRYQLGGVRTQLECQGLVGSAHLFKDLDYSNGRLPLLNETALVEADGMGIKPVDWSCNGSATGIVSRELDQASDWCAQGAGGGVVRDFDEWAAIVDVADHEGVYGDDVVLPYLTCAELTELHPEVVGSCSGVYPSLVSEGCQGGEMVFVSPDASIFFQSGTGGAPYKHLDATLGISPAGSVIYVQPGVQAILNPGPLVLDKAVILTGPGVAVVDP